MLMPKKVKYRKQQRGRMTGKAWRGSTLAFGQFGLKVLEPGWITDRQIEASRVAMTRFVKRGGKVWIRLFPDKPVTKKPAETRMGKGKGAPDHWVAVVRPGKILFEMEGVPVELAKEAMRLAAHKLPLKTTFVVRPGLKVEVAEAAMQFNIQQSDRRLSANSYRGMWNAEDRLHRLGFVKSTFDVNKNFEPKYILKVMKDHPQLFADLPPIPAKEAIGPGYVFKP